MTEYDSESANKPLNPFKLSPHITHFPSPLINEAVHLLSDKEKMERIAHYFREIMVTLGLDLKDESLQATPDRIAKMYVQEIFAGLNEDNFPLFEFFDTFARNHSHNNMVFSKVDFTSFCEHHFIPMIGCAHIAYVPQKKLIGLSKIPQIVRFFAARPQLQERLTAQIADSLALLLETEHVAVSVKASHCCVMARGMHAGDHCAITNVLRGNFQVDIGLRNEFLEAINR